MSFTIIYNYLIFTVHKLFNFVRKYIIGHELSHDSDFRNVVLLCLELAMRCFSGNFEMSGRQCVVSLTASNSHKHSNLKFKGDAPRAECVARVEKSVVSATQPDS
jgi:hypothetical protein